MRLFVALDLPDDIRRALAELIATLKPKSHAARWVHPENLHITLKFIGHVENPKQRPIQDALAAVHSAQAVNLHFHGMGFFPNEYRPRAVWCGIDASPNLTALAADIDRALAPLGVEPDVRPFTPHLTLARFKSNEDAGDVVKAAYDMKSYDFGSTVETNFHLYESLLKPTGAQYNRLASFPILAAQPQRRTEK
ncbi:MAG: RNA 2',3'-cyclic phosphodiesterase [Candidatus Acidiferrales bacterium]